MSIYIYNESNLAYVYYQTPSMAIYLVDYKNSI